MSLKPWNAGEERVRRFAWSSSLLLALVFIRFWETRIYTIDRTNSDDLRGINLLTTVCMILILSKMFIGVTKELRRAWMHESLDVVVSHCSGHDSWKFVDNRSTWSDRQVDSRYTIRSISYAWKPPNRLIRIVTRVVWFHLSEYWTKCTDTRWNHVRSGSMVRNTSSASDPCENFSDHFVDHRPLAQWFATCAKITRPSSSHSSRSIYLSMFANPCRWLLISFLRRVSSVVSLVPISIENLADNNE